MNAALTNRQLRELEYHRQHAAEHRRILDVPFSWDVLDSPATRWWNAYWAMYAYLVNRQLSEARVLVVGCGFGDDALRLAKLGARVDAFDLSPESLEIAQALALREGLEIKFAEMPAERMSYLDSSFDFVVARDILHHVDIPLAMAEIVRVAKPGATFVVNEIYSHSVTELVRRSSFVENFLYPLMRQLIYGPGKPYITEDERKLTEQDLAEIKRPLGSPDLEKYFNFFVTRVVPDRFDLLGKIDRAVLSLLRSLAPYLAGRVLLASRVEK